MLTEITGDLLEVGDGIICHQVNYYGVMGGGVAAAIRDNILTDEQYAVYVNFCKTRGRYALGTTQFLYTPLNVRIVANMFCQDEAENARCRQFGTITDYEYMKDCFLQVRNAALFTRRRVYIPRNIGCGIAGGDWATVRAIIQDVFADFPVEAFIVGRKE